MISNILNESMGGETWNTSYCLMMTMALLIACVYYNRPILSENTAHSDVADAFHGIFSEQQDFQEEIKPLGLAIAHEEVDVPTYARFEETYVNIGFAHYDERGVMDDDDDDILQQEVLEITFDFGSMEANIRRFLNRMKGVII